MQEQSRIEKEKTISELVHVLNEKGLPTGKSMPRAEVHEKGFWHGTVHVYVYNIVDNEPQILVHLRSPRKDLYPNTWDPVLGGHIKAGSNPTKTVIDELSDEVGLLVSPDDLIVGPVMKADKGRDKEFNHIFLCRFPSGSSVNFKDNEVQEVKWMGFDKVLQNIKDFPSRWRPSLNEFSTAYLAIKPLLTGK
jgi:isopentenyl-diphosphate Delta-isomerase